MVRTLTVHLKIEMGHKGSQQEKSLQIYFNKNLWKNNRKR